MFTWNKPEYFSYGINHLRISEWCLGRISSHRIDIVISIRCWLEGEVEFARNKGIYFGAIMERLNFHLRDLTVTLSFNELNFV